MKNVLPVLAVAAVILTSATSGFATGTENTAVKETVAKAQKAQAAKPKAYLGIVKETKDGVVLQTKDGAYPLEGLDLKAMVNKKVAVTGVMKGGQGNSSIFVLKADVQG